MKLTRRELAAAAAACVSAPARPPAREPEPAEEILRRNAAALDEFKLPAGTEPDFQFKA